MRAPSDIDAGDAERLVGGRVPVDDAELGDLARFLAALEEASPKASTEPCEAAHVAAMVAAAELLAAQVRTSVRPASEARGLMSLARGPRAPGRGGATRGHAGSRLAHAAPAAAMLALVFGGVAFGGALPPPLQDFVAGAAQHVGIELPRGDDAIADGAVDDVALGASRHGDRGRHLGTIARDRDHGKKTGADAAKGDKVDAKDPKTNHGADDRHGQKASRPGGEQREQKVDHSTDGGNGQKADKTDGATVEKADKSGQKDKDKDKD